MKSALYVPFVFAFACAATTTPEPPAGETTSPAAGHPSDTAANASNTPPAGDHLPPPFTADELRQGLPAGTEMKLRIDSEGAPTVIQHWVFTTADESGCTIAARTLADDGSLLRDEGEGTSTWRELESHAHFPAARTTRREVEIDVPAGTFGGWLYDVAPAKPDAPRERYYFARSMPGPPVLMETVQGESVVMRMALLSRSQPGS